MDIRRCIGAARVEKLQTRAHFPARMFCTLMNFPLSETGVMSAKRTQTISNNICEASNFPYRDARTQQCANNGWYQYVNEVNAVDVLVLPIRQRFANGKYDGLRVDGTYSVCVGFPYSARLIDGNMRGPHSIVCNAQTQISMMHREGGRFAVRMVVYWVQHIVFSIFILYGSIRTLLFAIHSLTRPSIWCAVGVCINDVCAM